MNLNGLRTLMHARAAEWGSHVRQRREAAGLTQAELVARIDGLTTQTVSKIERGEIDPRDHLKLGIALALNVEPADLFRLPSLNDVRRNA